MPARKNLIGCVFGKWTVIDYAGPGTVGATWNCSCECGTSRRVNASSLLAGTSTSCGCSGAEALGLRMTVHGHLSGGKHSPTYTVWRGMLRRCSDQTHPSYANYGGKGVAVCERWKLFEAFLEDMGERPDGKTLDRVDGSKGYSKSNCRWFTMKEQANNRANNHLLTFRGETHNIAEWATILGIKEGTIRARVCRGATDDEALKQ